MENITIKPDFLQQCNFLQLKSFLQGDIMDSNILQYIIENPYIEKYAIVRYTKSKINTVEFFDAHNNKFSTFYETENLLNDLSFFQKYHTSVWQKIINSMDIRLKYEIEKSSNFQLTPVELILQYIPIDPDFKNYLKNDLNIPIEDIEQLYL